MKVTRKSAGRDRFQKAMKDLTGANTKVGWFNTATYPDGTPVALVAAANEYGNVPEGEEPRSFMRTTLAEQDDNWTKAAGELGRRVAKGEMTAHSALDTLGALAEGDVFKKISEITEPPLLAATLAARRRRGNTSSKPLNYTGQMIAELTHLTSKK